VVSVLWSLWYFIKSSVVFVIFLLVASALWEVIGEWWRKLLRRKD